MPGLETPPLAVPNKEKQEACARLEHLRRQRRALEPAREEAWRRKMIALGHLEDEPAPEPRP